MNGDNNNPRNFNINLENMMNKLNINNNNGNVNNMGNNMGMNNIGINMGMYNIGNNMGMNNMGNMNMNNNQMMLNYWMMMNNGYQNNNIPNNMPNMNFPPNFPNYPMPVPNNNLKVLNVHYNNDVKKIEVSVDCKIDDFIKVIKKQFKINVFFKLTRQGKPLANKLTVAESGLDNGDNVFVIFPEKRFDDIEGYIKPINITFHLNKFNKLNSVPKVDLVGISKICYLKEISSKLTDSNLDGFPEDIKCLLMLLKKGKII